MKRREGYKLQEEIENVDSANELELRYGCNPYQKPARVFMKNGPLPFTVLNGSPGYINLLDAFNSWQLVKELKQILHLPGELRVERP